MAEKTIEHTEFQIPERIPTQLAPDYKYITADSVAVGHADPKVGRPVLLLNFARTAYLPTEVDGKGSIDVKQLVLGTVELDLSAAQFLHELLGKAIGAIPSARTSDSPDSNGG